MIRLVVFLLIKVHRVLSLLLVKSLLGLLVDNKLELCRFVPIGLVGRLLEVEVDRVAVESSIPHNHRVHKMQEHSVL